MKEIMLLGSSQIANEMEEIVSLWIEKALSIKVKNVKSFNSQ